MPIPQDLLDTNRRELLDLSTTNRLLAIPVTSATARLIHLRDERSEEVFRLLVAEHKALSFLPAPSAALKQATQGLVEIVADEEPSLTQPDDDIDPKTGKSRRHTDTRLQTALKSETLQTRLLHLYRDAQTLLEEQGVNTLYLALGQLKWFDPEEPGKARHAPLILVPVELVRAAAGDRFKLLARDEDVQENLSLEAKLRTDLNFQLPPFPDSDDLDPGAYLTAVEEVVKTRPTWEVKQHAITLGLFSFEKFLMYRDLDAANWPQPEVLLENPLLVNALERGFPHEALPFDEHADLDQLIPVEKLDHVVDADSSQTLAIELVRRGRNLVIQGPPGTGKSQSITNIIATAVLDGKRVLFVAQKLAALEVVKRRLEREGLGSLCLELHSEKCQKRAVLQEIATTWKRKQRQLVEPADLDERLARLDADRQRLNLYASALHTPLGPSGLAPFTVIGRLCALADVAPLVADLSFEGAERWTEAELRERRAVLDDLGPRLTQLGRPAAHPWFGVCREPVHSIDREPLAARIAQARDYLVSVTETSAETAARLRLPAPATLEQAKALGHMAAHVGAAPAMDPRALCEGVWAAGIDGLRALVAQGRTWAATNKELGALITPEAWSLDFKAERRVIAAHGDSLLRFLNTEYRRARNTLKGVLTGSLPSAHTALLALIDRLIVGQMAQAAITAGDNLGRSAFGTEWKGVHSDWRALESIVIWVDGFAGAGLEDSFRKTFSTLENPLATATAADRLIAVSAVTEAAIGKLSAELELDHALLFQSKDHRSATLRALLERTQTWLARMGDLLLWNHYHMQTRVAGRLGLGGLLARLESGAIAVGHEKAAFEYVHLCHVYRVMAKALPELGKFDGRLHNQLVEDFKTLDTERLKLAKYRVLAAQHSRLPPYDGVIGATGVLKGEIERKRGHRSVRRLLKEAGSVVQAIKPVLMMSPLSVARYLEPGAVEFDLLVIDEASQIEPVDALGAIARCKQIVVVGDSRQLPPTRFFQRATSDVPEPDDLGEPDATAARDVESILGLCRARGITEWMLRWHYRSRHQSLIAVSNQEFYQNQLHIVPSPWAEAPGLGVKFHAIEGGVFDRGGTSVNVVEAQAVARAVMEHARQRPNESLGVATFGLRQQMAILDELELLRRESPDTESFFNASGPENFFVKNLEQVQGDERDVLFISVSYARDRSGKMIMAFGPLGAEGGERRLNVLITRAKLRCEVFSSITSSDLDLTRAKGRGVAALKTYLDFAATGRLATAAVQRPTETPALLLAVQRALAAQGHKVELQVGTVGIFVDLAVHDPLEKGRYLIGIECDGPGYRSSRYARERDRLRLAVLRDQGWTIHRLWSGDWLQQKEQQLLDITASMERARSVAPARTAAIAPTSAEPRTSKEEAIELAMTPAQAESLATPYVEASFPVARGTEPQQLTLKEMTQVLYKIVELEGPIHEEELITRVHDLWGKERTGGQIKDAVARATRSLLIGKRCIREDSCLRLPRAAVPIRDRRAATSPGLCTPRLLPGAEIRATIVALLRQHHGAAPDEIPAAAARVLGFKSTSPMLRAAIHAQINRLQSDKVITEMGGMLRLMND